jgi:hypothetical protein
MIRLMEWTLRLRRASLGQGEKDSESLLQATAVDPPFTFVITMLSREEPSPNILKDKFETPF